MEGTQYLRPHIPVIETTNGVVRLALAIGGGVGASDVSAHVIFP